MTYKVQPKPSEQAMNFNSDPNLAALGKAAKSVGVELLPICRACERNGQAIWTEVLPDFDESYKLSDEYSLRRKDVECVVCGAPTRNGFTPSAPVNRDVIPRAFGVYFGRLNKAIQTAMKGLAAP